MQLLTKKSIWVLIVFTCVFLLAACSAATSVPPSTSAKETHTLQVTEVATAMPLVPTETIAVSPTNTKEGEATVPLTPTQAANDRILADVLSVTVSGNENTYTFAVEIRSPDTGCEQYADWWEVVTEDGTLIYRRILAHSHVGEQPFTRSGGPVAIDADTVVIVRAHMYPDGYGGIAFQGSVQNGFEEIQLEADFSPELESADPLPDGCAF